MKKVLLACLGLAVLCFVASDAAAVVNANGKWALHNAGAHNAKGNTCAFTVTDCTDLNTTGSVSTRLDIYVVAVDVVAIAGARYGICCDGSWFFYGWTNCADLEIPTSGWPGCGESNAQTWFAEQAGPHVTMGILDCYAYPGTSYMCTCVDSRVSAAEWCDGTEPNPICFQTDGSDSQYFGCIGFGGSGFNPCSIVPVEQKSWGGVKSLYR